MKKMDDGSDHRAEACRSDWRIIAVLIVASGLLRLVFVLAARDHPLFIRPVLDGEYYVHMASSFLAGRGACEGPYYVCPLYIYFLAAFLRCFGLNWTLLRLCHGLLGMGTLILAYFIGRRALGRKAAFVGLAIGAFYKPLFYVELFPLKTSLSFLLTSLSLFCLMKETWPRWGWILTGGLLGLSMACKGESGAFLAAGLLWIVWTGRVRKVPWILLGVGLAVSPFTFRNHWVSGEWVPLTWNVGTNLYQGNNPQSDGMGSMPDFVLPSSIHEAKSYQDEAERRSGRLLSATEVSKFWTRETISFFISKPWQALGLLGRKLLLYWNAQEVDDNLSIDFAMKAFWPMRLPLITFGLMAPWGILGMARRQGRTPPEALLILCIAFHCMGTTAFHLASRYRLAGAILLFPFAGRALVDFAEGLRHRDRILGRMGLWALCAAVVSLPLRIPSRHEGYVATLISVAMNEEERGRWTEAERCYRQAIDEDPEALQAVLGLGQSLCRQSRWQDAEGVYRQAAARWPEEAEVQVGLSRVLHRTGRSDQALDLLSRVLSQQPRSVAALYQKGRTLLETGRPAEAEQVFVSLLAGEGGSVDAVLSLCDCLVAQGKTDQARTTIRIALERIGPNEPLQKALERLHPE